MAKQLFANNVSVTINEELTASDTTITVSSTASFPAISGGDWIMATIVPQGGQGSREVVKITAISGNNLTVVRGQEGTTGQTFLFGSLLELRVTKGSLEELRDFTQTGTGAVTRTKTEKLQEEASVFDYMTAAEIAAVQAYTFTTNVQTACQTALDSAYAAKKNLYFPAGGYLVTGLVIPGTVDGAGTDDRDKGFRIYGQGFGEPFFGTNTGGTVIKSTTNAPVIQDILGTASSSNGTIEIDHIRFEGNSSGTNPVVRLQSFYGLSTFHNCVVIQRGTGDGIIQGWGATVVFRECYVMNNDLVTTGLGASRTGTGILISPTSDNGLVSIIKCTSRGWLTAYQIGGGSGAMYKGHIDKCEISTTYNGIILSANADGTTVSDCYFEGGDGGVGINNLGDYTTIRNCFMFPGYNIHIQDLGTSNKGTLIEGNLISIGSVGTIGIEIASSASLGGYNKNIVNNSIVYTAGTAGVSGVRISGAEPRITMLGNSFDPRGIWTGAGTQKINDISTGGIYGVVQAQLDSFEVPVLASGAVTYKQSSTALTQSNVAANVLTIPDAGSYFIVTATAGATVTSIEGGQQTNRVVVFRTTNANMTFQDSASMQLASGASFTGPGTLTLMVDKTGGSNFAWELGRTVF